MLFKSDTIVSPPEQPSLQGSELVRGDVYHAALNKVAKARGNLSDLLPAYAPDQVITYLQDDTWSLHHLIDFYLQHTGQACVYLTSWTISEDPVRALLQLKQSGRLSELHCVLDHRIKTLSTKPFQLLEAIMTSYAFSKVHAKVVCIRNDAHHVALVGSANLSRNRRKEAGAIFTGQAATDFHINWIKQTIDECNR